jgi:thiol-disulfide isomerase/thioredoxin
VDRVVLLVAVVAATAAVAAWWRAREGRVRARRPAPSAAATGPPSGAPLTLLELTAPSCAPCARAKLVLDAVAADRPAVEVRTVDIADALDLARAHRVLRAPTTLLVDGRGQVRAVVGGVPRREELEATVDALLADLLTPSRRGSVDEGGRAGRGGQLDELG